MLPYGTFSIYQVSSDGANIHYVRVARVQYAQTGTVLLEDRIGFARDLPDGPLDAKKQRFLNVLPMWSYYHVAQEQPGETLQPTYSHPL